MVKQPFPSDSYNRFKNPCFDSMGDDYVQVPDYNGNLMSSVEAAIVEWHGYLSWLHGMMTVAIAVQPGFT